MWMRLNPLQSLVLVGSLLSSSCQAVFQDEAFHTDFQLALFGTAIDPSNIFFHQAATDKPGSLLYTLSNRLVFGAINPKDGAHVWRQQLGQGNVTETEGLVSDAILRKSKDGRVVSGFRSSIGLWDATNGRAIWELNLKDLHVVDLVTLESDGLLVAAFKGGEVKSFDVNTGELHWETAFGEG